MRYSLNQIEHTVRKATRGAGLSWGVAEDAGRAARWLHMVGISGVSLVATVLEEINHEEDDARKVMHSEYALDTGHVNEFATILKATGERLSPLVVGPCIGDWANAIKTTEDASCLNIESVTQPLLLAGYCGVAAQQTKLMLSVEWQNSYILCSEKGIRYVGDSLQSEHQNRITVSSVNTVVNQLEERKVRIGGAEVDAAAWKQLERLSHRTYVEATESSRLSGAGAGLNDND